MENKEIKNTSLYCINEKEFEKYCKNLNRKELILELKYATVSRLTLCNNILFLLNIVSKYQDVLPSYKEMDDFLKSCESIAKEQQKIIEQFQ